MSEAKKLISILEKLSRVLDNEKEALVKNDVSALSAIVEKKKELINAIEENKEEYPYENEETRKIIHKILEKQETNMLLTNQAIEFQNQLLGIFARSSIQQHNTYSSKGTLCSAEINIVDQKI